MNFLDPDEMTVLAGEYVLGILPPEDVEEFERELRQNRALAAAVAAWHDRFLELAPEPVPADPVPDLWNRIERDLPGKATHAPRGGLWNSLAFWKASGLASIALSALLALRLLTIAPDVARPQYLAVLQAPDQGANWLVEIDSRAVRLRPLSPAAVAPGKAIQFWTKPEGAAGPTSLGLVAGDRPTQIPLDRLPGLGPNQLFEVTLEPATGSPVGRPTGPILAVGKAIPL
ncbi:MAG TPA: anti-sigma factor [Noviherbaspirillum sp.]|jgi:anti-sigma-K factor RskA|uniref:anti-sigma factor n=1 Tax=Noviherbaspirillum sp. TaxID=1926288 RepID=UPI002DDD1721|nr:anti-sigma factor [Noviherbaspirillum sp.]HEV2613009.1 anti-sigma factor [Noviherbaspirillum sp.]